MFPVQQFLVTFDDHEWLVSGEDNLTSLCETLRWNGIYAYGVRPWDSSKDIDPRTERIRERSES